MISYIPQNYIYQKGGKLYLLVFWKIHLVTSWRIIFVTIIKEKIFADNFETDVADILETTYGTISGEYNLQALWIVHFAIC